MKIKSPWGKTTTLLVLGFLVGLFLMLSLETKATTKVEVSTYLVWVGGHKYNAETLLMAERSENKKYEVGFLLQNRLDCAMGSACKRGSSPRANQAIYLQRNVYYKDFFMFIGVSYWSSFTPAWNSHTPYALGMGYDITDSMSINYRHFSTGGTSSNNGGLDMLTWGYSF